MEAEILMSSCVFLFFYLKHKGQVKSVKKKKQTLDISLLLKGQYDSRMLLDCL